MFVNGPLVDQETQFKQAQSTKVLKRDCSAVLEQFDTLLHCQSCRVQN